MLYILEQEGTCLGKIQNLGVLELSEEKISCFIE